MHFVARSREANFQGRPALRRGEWRSRSGLNHLSRRKANLYRLHHEGQSSQGVSEGKTGEVTLNLPSNADFNGMQVEFFFSETGWLTIEIFFQMAETSCVRWELLHPGLHASLFPGNLSVHRNAVVVKKLEKIHVFPVFFPLGATHVIQPLDFWAFPAFKSSLDRWVREVQLSFHG